MLKFRTTLKLARVMIAVVVAIVVVAVVVAIVQIAQRILKIRTLMALMLQRQLLL
jgi:hypothetical protein